MPALVRESYSNRSADQFFTCIERCRSSGGQGPVNPDIDSIDWNDITRIRLSQRQDSVTDEWKPEYVAFGPSVYNEQFDYDAEWIDHSLDNLVETMEARMRRLGLGLLIIGFIQQGIAALYSLTL